MSLDIASVSGGRLAPSPDENCSSEQYGKRSVLTCRSAALEEGALWQVLTKGHLEAMTPFLCLSGPCQSVCPWRPPSAISLVSDELILPRNLRKEVPRIMLVDPPKDEEDVSQRQ